MNLTLEEVQKLLGERDLLIYELVKQLRSAQAQITALTPNPKPVEPEPPVPVQ